MIEGLALTDNFQNNKPQKNRMTYTLHTKGSIKGPLRLIQKFVVILLTSSGTDPMHPWFGTEINKLTQMNITKDIGLESFIRKQCNSAISQFFRLQADENIQNKQTGYDIIQTLQLTTLNINNDHTVTLVFTFTPLKSDSITFSIDITGK